MTTIILCFLCFLEPCLPLIHTCKIYLKKSLKSKIHFALWSSKAFPLQTGLKCCFTLLNKGKGQSIIVFSKKFFVNLICPPALHTHISSKPFQLVFSNIKGLKYFFFVSNTLLILWRRDLRILISPPVTQLRFRIKELHHSQYSDFCVMFKDTSAGCICLLGHQGGCHDFFM